MYIQILFYFLTLENDNNNIVTKFEKHTKFDVPFARNTLFRTLRKIDKTDNSLLLLFLLTKLIEMNIQYCVRKNNCWEFTTHFINDFFFF